MLLLLHQSAAASSHQAHIPDGSHNADLPSTRNRLRTAVRRGAPWPTNRPSSCLVVREAVSRRQIASRPSLHGSPAQQAPSTGTRLGVPARDRSAWWPRGAGCRPCRRHSVRVLGQRPASSVRCERQCPRVSARSVSGVRCPVRASERLGVQCPMSSVRAFPLILERGWLRCPHRTASANWATTLVEPVQERSCAGSV
jgi:hypothetical protein